MFRVWATFTLICFGSMAFAGETANLGMEYIVILRRAQKLFTVRDGKIVGTYHCSSGRAGMETRLGTWKVTSKAPVSRALEEFGGGKLEWVIRVPTTRKNGSVRRTAIHAYKSVPKYNASHGCIRVQKRSAKAIYDFAKIGMSVLISESLPRELRK